MIYLTGALAILANIIFYIFLKFSLWILFFNTLIFFVFVIFVYYQKEDQNIETKKKIITNFNSELGKKDLERLFIDKIEDVIIILNKFNVIIYANKSATNNFGDKLEGKHINVAVRISELLDQIDQHRIDKEIKIINIEIKNPIFKFFKTSISNIQSEQILLVFKDFTEVQKSQIIRSDFIANASHNLKTPLVSLKGFETKNNKRIILLTTKAKKIYYNFQFKRDDTILFGRESAGVPDSVHKIVNERLKIPISKDTRSLNVVTSVSIVLSEALRQNNYSNI